MPPIKQYEEGIFGFEWQNVLVLFLPPNTTPRVQPCDAGIIYSFKVQQGPVDRVITSPIVWKIELETYEHIASPTQVCFLYEQIRWQTQRFCEGAQSVNMENATLAEAVKWVRRAWKAVPSNLIRHAWDRCRILPTSSLDEAMIERAVTDEKALRAEVTSAISELSEQRPSDGVLSIDEAIKAYEDIFNNTPAQSMADIAAELGDSLDQEEEESPQFEEGPNKNLLSADCSAADISRYAATVLEWIEDHVEDYGEATRTKAEEVKSRIDKTIRANNMQQMSIDSFFPPHNV